MTELKGDTRSFDEHGVIDNMERLEPHFSNAMVELTERKAYSKSEIAVLLAERDVKIESQQAVMDAAFTLFGFILTCSTAPRLDRLVNKAARSLGIAFDVLFAKSKGEG